MDSSQDVSGNDRENVADDAEEGLNAAPEGEAQAEQEGTGQDSRNDPLYVQKRLKQQKRSHDREMREMQARIGQLQSQLQPNQNAQPQPSPYNAASNGSGVNDEIHQAVGFALQQRDLAERQAKQAQSQQHLARQYQELDRHLDSTSDKYDDFDDVVRGDGTPFTPAMRDIALTLPKKGQGSAGEVLYKLGKNPDELSRIAKLHPLDQASELIALSHALISGGGQKQSSPAPLGQIKSNPVVNSVGVTEKTPVSDLRARMKQGTFK